MSWSDEVIKHHHPASEESPAFGPRRQPPSKNVSDKTTPVYRGTGPPIRVPGTSEIIATPYVTETPRHPQKSILKSSTSSLEDPRFELKRTIIEDDDGKDPNSSKSLRLKSFLKPKAKQSAVIKSVKIHKKKPLFPANYIHDSIRTFATANSNIDPGVAMFFMALQEYMANEILENSGNLTMARGSTEVSEHDIVAAIFTDYGLRNVLDDCSEFEEQKE